MAKKWLNSAGAEAIPEMGERLGCGIAEAQEEEGEFA